MPLSAGIIGLPYVGKTTLFNALTNLQISTTNYPSSSSNANTGIAPVYDERVVTISRLFKSAKTVFATFEFRDVAGLVKGSSKGEGLGNKFLSIVREVDALCHVVRCFEDDNLLHVEGSIDPARDVETINLELILADLESVEKRLAKVEKKATVAKEAEAIMEYQVLLPIVKALNEGKPARSVPLSKEQALYAKGFHLLTMKPVIYVANVAESDIQQPMANPYVQQLQAYVAQEDAPVVAICAKVEAEIAALSGEEKELFLAEYQIQEPGLNKITQTTYSLLGLATFLTGGPEEARAWTFKVGFKAPQCAGVIHSDFEKGFIKAAVYRYEDLLTYGSEQAVKEAGKIRLEGKEYIMKDGDVVHFRFNI